MWKVGEFSPHESLDRDHDRNSSSQDDNDSSGSGDDLSWAGSDGNPDQNFSSDENDSQIDPK